PDYGVGGARFAPGTFSSPVPVGTHLYYGDGNTKIDSGVTVTDYYLENGPGGPVSVLEFEGFTNEAYGAFQDYALSSFMDPNDVTI
ncbi:hypothetical protein, partial [Polynucleobacter sp. MWH-Berg-3C6]|uniref:hypothetical protein n=1 Tax=Polynucleobacter sp. MWH-Berg-3C6 TaxID=1855882 RepID=UPI001C0BE2B4